MKGNTKRTGRQAELPALGRSGVPGALLFSVMG